MKQMKMLKFKLLLEPIKKDNVRDGVFIPDAIDQDQYFFKVVDVGEYACDDEVRAGDVVVVDKYAGTEVRSGGSIYRIVDEDDVLAKVVSEQQIYF